MLQRLNLPPTLILPSFPINWTSDIALYMHRIQNLTMTAIQLRPLTLLIRRHVCRETRLLPLLNQKISPSGPTLQQAIVLLCGSHITLRMLFHVLDLLMEPPRVTYKSGLVTQTTLLVWLGLPPRLAIPGWIQLLPSRAYEAPMRPGKSDFRIPGLMLSPRLQY